MIIPNIDEAKKVERNKKTMEQRYKILDRKDSGVGGVHESCKR